MSYPYTPYLEALFSSQSEIISLLKRIIELLENTQNERRGLE